MRLTLKAARVNAGLSQKEAAEKLKIDLAIEMAKLYNCTLGDIIFLQQNIA